MRTFGGVWPPSVSRIRNAREVQTAARLATSQEGAVRTRPPRSNPTVGQILPPQQRPRSCPYDLVLGRSLGWI